MNNSVTLKFAGGM